MQLFWERMIHTFQLTGFHFGDKPPGWTFRQHHHHLFEVMHCRKGCTQVEIRNRTIELGSGDWILLKPGVRHSFFNDAETECSLFNVHFDIDDADIRKLLGSSAFYFISKQRADCTRLPALYHDIEHGVRNHQSNLLTEQDPLYAVHQLMLKLSIQAYTLLLVQELLSLRIDEWKKASDLHQSETAQNSKAPLSTLFQTNTAHRIEQKLAATVFSDTSIGDISRELNISRYQCTKIFTQVYGISPRQYLSQLKLNQAKELLVQTDKTVEEIARRLGFGSVQHFSRQFHRWTGMAPSQFRPKHSE